MSDINETLAERGARYGKFKTHAAIAQGLKNIMTGYMRFADETEAEARARTAKWNALSPDKKEALDIIAHKIARILNGDPEYADNWHDIIGYAKLVEDNIYEANARMAVRVSEKPLNKAEIQRELTEDAGADEGERLVPRRGDGTLDHGARRKL